ncbi:MAG: tetratricopeptide repeat protein [Chloroflexota bacterium]
MERDIQLLGTLSIRDGDGKTAAILSSPKGCALLAYLIVRGQTESREHLADVLWEPSSTSQGLRNLRVLLTRIRAWLPDVVITRKTIAFTPLADEQVDYLQLQEALEQKDTEKLLTGLQLYRGDLLTGFYLDDAPRFQEWLIIERERLRQTVLTAFRTLCQEYVKRADWPAVVAVAKRWLTVDELNEEAVYQLIQALSASGELNAARQAYEIFQTALKREVGVVPETETAVLYEEIKVRLKKRKRPFVADLIQPKHNLPTQSTPFIGRQAELTKIADLLANQDCRLLTIHASGGTGKTRLALAIAEKQLAAYRDGVTFVPLASVQMTDFDSAVTPLVSTVAEALPFTFRGSQDPEEQLLNFLQPQKKLFVIDNFEHLLETADFLSKLLTHAPDIKVLVTSRERLNLYEEWLFPLEGLPYPAKGVDAEDVNRLKHDDLESYGAIQLFIQRAKQTKPSFAHADQLENILRIAQLVEGMPLGLELAATWVRQLSCQEIVKEIEAEIDFLATTLRNLPERHRSLRAVFAYSWERLSAEEKLILQKLAVFRGGFQREAALTVANASLRHLTTFVDKSLLTMTEEGRYGIHELMRQFLAEKLAENSNLEQQTQALHGQTYLKFMANLESKFVEKEFFRAAQAYQRDIDNIRAAWFWGVSSKQYALLNDTLLTIRRGTLAKGWYLEARNLLSVAITEATAAIQSNKTADSLQDETQLFLARAQGILALFLHRLGMVQEAKTNFERSLSLFQTIGREDDRARGYILATYGFHLQYTGGMVKARHVLEKAVQLSNKINHIHLSAFALMILGQIEYWSGQFEEAERVAQECNRLLEAFGTNLLSPYNLSTLGWVAEATGRYGEAEAHYQSCLEMRVTYELKADIAITLNDLGNVARLQGELAKAKEYYQTALDIASAFNHSNAKASAMRGLGFVTSAMGNYDLAKSYFTEAYQTSPLLSKNGGQNWLAFTLGELAKSHQGFTAMLKAAWQTSRYPDIIDALAGLTFLEAEAGNNEKSLALVTLILHHHACVQEVKDRLYPLRDELRSKLSKTAVAAAEAQGLNMNVDHVAQSFLDEV